MKKFLSILLASVMLVSFTACSSEPVASGESEESASGAEATVKQELNVVLASEPLNLNPQNAAQLNAYIVNFLLYDTLLVQGENGEILPNLATTWEQIDDTHIRFTLRDDVYFSNGDQMTSADVVYTMQRCATAPTTKNTYKFFDPEGTVAEDEFTFVLALTQPFSATYDYLTHAYSSIVNASVMEEVGEEAYGLAPIGTGAYTLDEWVTGSTIKLKRNDAYWGEKGASEYVQFKIITEIASRAIELETGAADVVLDMATNDANRIKETPGLVLVTEPSYKTTYVGINISKDKTDDPLVREALATALDLEILAQNVYGEYAAPADSVMAMTIPGHTSVMEHEYNVEKAKELLAQAGYPDGIDITGRAQTNSDFKKIAEVLQNMWAEAGIRADIQVLDRASYTELGKTDGGTNITITSQTSTTGNAYQALGTTFSTASTTGIISSTDTELEAKIAQAAATYDTDERNAIYEQIQQTIVNDHYVIPIAFTDIVIGVSEKVEGFKASPANTPDFTYVYAYN